LHEYGKFSRLFSITGRFEILQTNASLHCIQLPELNNPKISKQIAFYYICNWQFKTIIWLSDRIWFIHK